MILRQGRSTRGVFAEESYEPPRPVATRLRRVELTSSSPSCSVWPPVKSLKPNSQVTHTYKGETENDRRRSAREGRPVHSQREGTVRLTLKERIRRNMLKLAKRLPSPGHPSKSDRAASCRLGRQRCRSPASPSSNHARPLPPCPEYGASCRTRAHGSHRRSSLGGATRQ